MRRNTELFRQCTKDGLLYGSSTFISAGEPVCVHHSFCHAKALATCLEHGYLETEEVESGENSSLKVSLSSENRNGVVYYPSVHVELVGKGDWLAIVSDYDIEYRQRGHATGGARALLWHKNLGSVFAGTMGNYHLVEPNNKQFLRNSIPKCLTPRLCAMHKHEEYENINNLTVSVTYEEQPDMVTVTASGMQALDCRIRGKKGEWLTVILSREER